MANRLDCMVSVPLARPCVNGSRCLRRTGLIFMGFNVKESFLAILTLEYEITALSQNIWN